MPDSKSPMDQFHYLMGGTEDARKKYQSVKAACQRCGGSGWLDAIGPKEDGSYITSRPCPCGIYKGLGR